MPCHQGDGVVICRPPDRRYRTIRYCPVCETKRRFVAHDLGTYYGFHWTCCGCGDSFMDGYLLERPFKRGWRAESIAKAKRDWAKAAALSTWRLDLDEVGADDEEW